MRVLQAVATLAVLAGCATTEEAQRAAQQPAIDAAIARASAEMNCRETQAKILGRASTKAPGYGGLERQQYTIGVEGCGKSMTTMVVCSEGSNCFVAGTDRR